jgi:hypothetical protein
VFVASPYDLYDAPDKSPDRKIEAQYVVAIRDRKMLLLQDVVAEFC